MAEINTSNDGLSRIAAPSERLALDWSLVLASQDIAAIIENDPVAGWGLHVPAATLPRALDAIQAYRRENRRWPWQRAMLEREVIFDWAATLWLVLTGVAFQLQNFSPWFRQAGILDSVAVANGQWWRCFTATFLHGDLLHLATNSVFGMILLGFAMGRFGTGVGLLAAYLSGVVGNVFSWVINREAHFSLGASGVVMAGLGLLAAQSLAGLRRDRRTWRVALSGLAAGGMLFVLVGMNPESDVAAHFGGFVAGIISGGLLVILHRTVRSPRANILAGIFFVTLVIWPWLLALRSAR